jgi:hypothetical protein
MKNGIHPKLRLNLKVQNNDGSNGIQIAIDKRYDDEDHYFVATLIGLTENDLEHIRLDPEGEELGETALSQFLFYVGSY